MDTDAALMKSVQNILKDIAHESIMINKTIPFNVQALSPKSMAQRVMTFTSPPISPSTGNFQPARTGVSDRLNKALAQVQQLNSQLNANSNPYGSAPNSFMPKRQSNPVNLSYSQQSAGYRPVPGKTSYIDSKPQTKSETGKLSLDIDQVHASEVLNSSSNPENKVIDLHKMQGLNIDAYVKPKSPIENIVKQFVREDPQMVYQQSHATKAKYQRPSHLKRLAKNIVPTFQEAIISQNQASNDQVQPRFTNKTRHFSANNYSSIHKYKNMLSSPSSLQSYQGHQQPHRFHLHSSNQQDPPCPANFPLNFVQ